MVFKRASRPTPDQIEVIIGRRATFNGQLRCDASVRLDGTVEGGLIETAGNVLITEFGRVMADIVAKTVSIAGAYKGTITADRVELLEGGRLWGTIKVRTFLLDEGAHFHGELIMQGIEPEEPLLAPRPPDGAAIPVETGQPAVSETEPPESGTEEVPGRVASGARVPEVSTTGEAEHPQTAHG
jgi:cytoskeletal protein CcmA (bactofilin family)